jgi:hypothetical protein
MSQTNCLQANTYYLKYVQTLLSSAHIILTTHEKQKRVEIKKINKDESKIYI